MALAGLIVGVKGLGSPADMEFAGSRACLRATVATLVFMGQVL
jgi:hypothetical protein